VVRQPLLSNDEGLYQRTQDTARQYVGDAGDLSRVLKDWVTDELAPDLGASFAADLLGYALAELTVRDRRGMA